MKENIETVSEQYDLFRLLDRDEYVPTTIQDLLIDEQYYYVKLSSDGSESITLYIRFNRGVDIPHREYSIFAELVESSVVTPSELSGVAVQINPDFDESASLDDGVLGSVGVETGDIEYHPDLMINRPTESHQLSKGEIEELQWKANVSRWYLKNKSDGEIGVETQLGEIVNVEKSDKNTVTFDINLGYESSTLTFPVPPHGKNVAYVKEFIEGCGGTLENMEGTPVILAPNKNAGDQYVLSYQENGYIQTDDGEFAVGTVEQFDQARIKHDYGDEISEYDDGELGQPDGFYTMMLGVFLGIFYTSTFFFINIPQNSILFETLPFISLYFVISGLVSLFEEDNFPNVE